LTTPVPPLPAPYLRAIVALPDDDGPRLCAADWWDEQGTAERAEFIRVQCELARWPCECDTSEERVYHDECRCKERAELRRRERELRTYDNVISWLPVVEPWGTFLSATCASHLGPGDAHCCNGPSPIAKAEFRRGFVEELTAVAADFLAHADALTAACPLRRVRLTTRPEVEWASADVALRLAGRGWRSVSELFPGDSRGVNRAMMLQAYLAAEFPGIDFEMPTTGFRPGSLSPSQLPLTFGGAPILGWPAHSG
jgi:uncharacterized protein (TIGR02996 family)